MIAAEVLHPAGLVLGEGPISLGGDNFACVDIRRGQVLYGDMDGNLQVTRTFDGPVSALALLDDGDVLVATRNAIETLGAATDTIRLPNSSPRLRMNDGKPDPSGRFVVGTMADPVRPFAGSLWSFSAGRCRCLIDRVTISNGLCWSADATTMFYIDTPTRRIDAFDYDNDTGSVSDRRTVARIADGLGDPDGMTIDAAGGLWVAMWGGGTVVRYMDGHIDERIDVGTPYVTCPVFAGAGLNTLLITTASEPSDSGPGAGHLYFAAPGISGLEVSPVPREVLFDS